MGGWLMGWLVLDRDWLVVGLVGGWLVGRSVGWVGGWDVGVPLKIYKIINKFIDTHICMCINIQKKVIISRDEKQD